MDIKKNVSKGAILVFISFFGMTQLHAQDWYTNDKYSEVTDAYVITTDGEKIEAHAWISYPWTIVNEFSFAHPEIQKEGKKEKFKSYKAGSFAEFGFDGLKFVYRKLPSMVKANLLVVIDGKASFYEYYEIEGSDKKTVNYVEVNGKLMPLNDVRLANFKKGGAKLFADCKTVADKISSGEYTIKNIQEIISEYNTLLK